MTESKRLVKLYLRVELPLEGQAYRREICRLLSDWHRGLSVEAFEVKEGVRGYLSYYADIDSDEYREAFGEYHLRHGWNVDEMTLLGFTVETEFLQSYQINYTADMEPEESEVRIYWKRPGRDARPRSLDCWLIKYDGSATSASGGAGAVDEVVSERASDGAVASDEPVYRKGLMFCAPYNLGLRRKLNRLSFKWERFLTERQLSYRRWDNFAEFDQP